MTTIDLRQQLVTLHTVLEQAHVDQVIIVGLDGERFVLERMDAFTKEVELLAKSDRFRALLDERRAEPATITLDAFEAELAAASEAPRSVDESEAER